MPDTVIEITADVLVIGGSLAGAWAALSARAAGASVVLAEKGYVGTAGVVAAANVGGYSALPDNPEQRRSVIHARHDAAFGLDDLAFIEKVYDESYGASQRLAALGRAEGEGPLRADLTLTHFPGPSSMRFLRNQLERQGVRILDHCPALELLSLDGTVSGASGVNRQTDEGWTVRAGATILATGGNAFRSGAMGTNGVTGDGHLLAAELGATMVGMEFSGHYGIAPAKSTCTKGFWYGSATFYDANRRELGINGWEAVPAVARAVMETGGAFARIDRGGPGFPERARRSTANIFQYFDRVGIDPFAELFPLELVYEGTVRASGGIAVDGQAATGVPGLYAAGDVTDRTRLTGASMSGAGPAVAWCLASGEWAGRNAAAFAAGRTGTLRAAPLRAEGGVGVRPRAAPRETAANDLIRRVQNEILPIANNVYRSDAFLRGSLARLETLWDEARLHLGGRSGRERLRAREAASLIAGARWIYTAAAARTESRGLHRRTDHPETDPAQCYLLRTGGLDRPFAGPVSAAAE